MECKQVFKTLSILYVEDEEMIRNLLREVLQEDFKRFEVAQDGIEGLEKFRSDHFDIVITDIEMPKLEGLDFAARIRALSKDIPILVLTAYSEKERLFRAIDVGITKYLIKPFTPEKLLQVLCQIVKERFMLTIRLRENMEYSFLTKTIKQGERSEKLTKKEALFFELLLRNAHRIVTLDEIERTLWPEGDFSEDAIRSVVKRVRKKSSKDLIKNFPAQGYKIDI